VAENLSESSVSDFEASRLATHGGALLLAPDNHDHILKLQVYSGAEVLMAEWQYQIQRVELRSGSDFDQELETTLQEYGAKGWELVEVLPQHDSPSVYRLIFKAPKPLD